jgi:hypothetical protein
VTLVKSGATRWVFLTRRYAIKFPRPRPWRSFLWGLLANAQEREFATTDWPELCPVYWSVRGGWLLVMPRCLPLAKDLTEEQYAAFTVRPEYSVPVEHKRDSFGYLNGRLVAIDYGS